ncbi:MAG: hypothetical protein DHS20C15_03400 [Planctomycetota bacterium]|nr:MAG: hypothetical protein DHS20C15_03400 [Planctomycetota bacterium]
MTINRTAVVGLLALFSLLSACSGVEYATRSAQYNVNGWTETQYVSTNYTILGPVEAEGEGMTVIGFFGEGVDGVGLLWEQAREQYGDEVTGLKDITQSSEWLSVLGWLYARVHTTYRAVAIKEG